MKKFLLLPLLLLTACGSKVVKDLNPDNLPVYCIRDAEIIEDGEYVMLDMPGLWHGQNDKPMKVSMEVYESIASPFCAADDPRMTENADI